MVNSFKTTAAIEHLFAANPIKGNFCQLHHVTLEDAEMIYDLRTNRKGSYLKPMQGNLDDQKEYLESYFGRFQRREEIYYKIFDVKAEKFCGILRITELQNEKVFNWQSFIVSETTSPNASIDAMLMVYRIGFEFLNRDSCGPWVVDKNFLKMIKIHDLIKMAKIVGGDEQYHYFAVQKADYESNINRFLKMSYGGLKGLYE